MPDVLKITDGTDQVDLLALREGVSVEGWRQAVATYKGDGAWQQSSLSDGRVLVDKRFNNPVETFPLAVVDQPGAGGDVTIGVLHNLFALMEKASNYWVDKWRDEPVWLESRADCETNTRYAIIYTAVIPQLDDIFSTAFMNDGTLQAMLLVIERGHWTENTPGAGTAVELSVVSSYGGRNLGNVDSTGTRDPTTADDEVFAVNKSNIANFTHVYWENIATGAWSGNLMAAALPFGLTDALLLGQSGRTYFGIDSTLGNSGPFTNLVLDIGTASVNLQDTAGAGNWQFYRAPGAWVAVSAINDDGAVTPPIPTLRWSTTGVTSFHFQPQIVFGVNDWQTANLQALFGGAAPNVTAYWVRIDYTATANITVPTQQSRDIYTVTWPYVDLQADQATGNIDSLCRIRVLAEAGDTGDLDTGVGYDAQVGRLLMALRSLERGSDFNAYINIADEQNPTGVTVTRVGVPAWTNTTVVPTERALLYTSVGAGFVYIFRVTWSSGAMAQYRGKYRLFIRARTDDVTPSNSQVKAELGVYDASIPAPSITPFWSSTVQFSVLPVSQNYPQFELLDMGEIELPAPVKALLDSETGGNIRLIVYADAANTQTVLFCDLIFLPIDEWATELTEHRNAVYANEHVLQLSKAETNVYSTTRRYMDLDCGLIVPKEFTRSNLKEEPSNRFIGNWLTVKNARPYVASSGAQRLWFLGASQLSNSWISSYNPCWCIAIDRNAQYLGPRGAA